jgi:hypothetical protein
MAARGPVLLTIESSILLLVSLWLPWFLGPRFCAYPDRVFGSCPYAHWSAWSALKVADVVLAVLAASAIANTLIGPAVSDRIARRVGLSARLGRMVVGMEIAAAGWGAVALSIYSELRPSLPTSALFGRGRFPLPVFALVPDYGFLIALLAAGGIIGGGWWLALTQTTEAS